MLYAIMMQCNAMQCKEVLNNKTKMSYTPLLYFLISQFTRVACVRLLSGRLQSFDQDQTEENLRKIRKKKHFNGEVAVIAVQSLVLYQYPVDLITFLEL